jgi:hypothetical protein
VSDTDSRQPGPGPLHAAADGTEPAQAVLGPTDANTYGLAASDLLAALNCGIGRSYDRRPSPGWIQISQIGLTAIPGRCWR